MYVVLGGTGKIGKRISEKLLAQGKKVKVIARDKTKLEDLAKKGAEIVSGDAADSTLLAKTFSGAEGIFVMLPPDLTAENMGAHQDQIGESITKAIKESGVKFIVNLSSMGAHLPSGTGPIAGTHRQENRLNAIPGINVLHLRPSYFLENLFGSIGMIKGMGINGSPMRGDIKVAQIATQDIGDYAALRLLKLDFQGKGIQELLGQRDISMEEATTILGNAIGKPDLKYVQFPYPDALQAMVGMGFSKSVAENFVEMHKAFNDGILGKAERTAANTTPTSIEEFAKFFAAAYNS